MQLISLSIIQATEAQIEEAVKKAAQEKANPTAKAVAINAALQTLATNTANITAAGASTDITSLTITISTCSHFLCKWSVHLKHETRIFYGWMGVGWVVVNAGKVFQSSSQ